MSFQVQQVLASRRKLAEASRLDLTKWEESRKADIRSKVALSQSERLRLKQQRDAEWAAAESEWKDQQSKVSSCTYIFMCAYDYTAVAMQSL